MIKQPSRHERVIQKEKPEIVKRAFVFEKPTTKERANHEKKIIKYERATVVRVCCKEG